MQIAPGDQLAEPLLGCRVDARHPPVLVEAEKSMGRLVRNHTRSLPLGQPAEQKHTSDRVPARDPDRLNNGPPAAVASNDHLRHHCFADGESACVSAAAGTRLRVQDPLLYHHQRRPRDRRAEREDPLEPAADAGADAAVAAGLHGDVRGVTRVLRRDGEGSVEDRHAIVGGEDGAVGAAGAGETSIREREEAVGGEDAVALLATVRGGVGRTEGLAPEGRLEHPRVGALGDDAAVADTAAREAEVGARGVVRAAVHHREVGAGGDEDLALRAHETFGVPYSIQSPC